MVELTGEKAANPETVFQHCEGETTGGFLTRGRVVSTTVSITTMEIFKETLGQISISVCGEKKTNRYHSLV